MASRTLTFDESERFYRLREQLAVFALQFYEDPEDLEDMSPEEQIRAVLRQTWRNPALLDSYIAENPHGLGPEDLATVASWKNSLSGAFTAFEHEGEVLLLSDGSIFEVCGLTQPVEEVLSIDSLPQVVETTLLPFAGRVVYDASFASYPVFMGEGLLRVLDDDINQALASAERVRTAQRLEQLAPHITEKRIKEQTERMIEELELDMRADEPIEGCHKGVLAGLTDEEREAAISASIPNSGGDYLAKVLSHFVTKGEPTRSLVDLMVAESKATLQRWAYIHGLDMPKKATKKDLVSALVPAMQKNPFVLDSHLRVDMSPNQLAAYRSFYESGGWLEVPEAELTTLAGQPPLKCLASYLFYTKGPKKGQGTFTFAIPEETMAMLPLIDWNETEQFIELTTAVVDIAEALADLRGIVPLGDAYSEYAYHYPEALSENIVIDEDDFLEVLEYAAQDGILGCNVLDAPEGFFILSLDLGVYYREAMNLPEPSYNDPLDPDDPFGCFLDGSLDPLAHILAEQQRKPPRGLEEGMLLSDNLFRWKLALPAVRAMRDFLDANVPDGENDYDFADDVLYDLLDFMEYGIRDAQTVHTYFEIIEDHGLVPDSAHLKRMLDLLMNMANSLPCWTNNGWAPSELHEAATGHKTFYNEDGSVMKVGRNDPCPCGSGKKYKKCCGR